MENSAVDLLFARSLLKHAASTNPKMERTLSRLMAESRKGHLCIEMQEDDEVPQELVETSDVTFCTKPLCLWNNLLYLQKNWSLETQFLNEIKRLQKDTHHNSKSGFFPFPSPSSSNFSCSTSPLFPPDRGCFEQLKLEAQGLAKFPLFESRWVERCQELPLPSTLPPRLNDSQKEAFLKAFLHPISLITGGPGTGKTFVAAAIVEALLAAGFDPCEIAIAAPTGKAAIHFHSTLNGSDITCSTLHRLLNVRSSSDFASTATELFYKLIIVDECSMIDIRLFLALFQRTRSNTRLILMGDQNQLTPVESGSCFSDLVRLQLFPTTTLTKGYRTDRADYKELAEMINEGRADEALEYITGKIWLELDKRGSTHIRENLFSFVESKISCVFKEKPSLELLMEQAGKFKILSCIRKGVLGVDFLNSFLVNEFYKKAKLNEWLAIPIMITRNDVERGLYNGQMAILLHQVKGDHFCPNREDEVYFLDRTAPFYSLDHWEIGFCLSVHKSQGSEYDEVLLLIPQGSDRFGREVLYTAITRARKTLFVYGNAKVIKEAIMTSSYKRSGVEKRCLISSS